jgi:hypothetical protein
VPSAQVKTCVLLAGLQTAGTTTVRESIRTRDHSELALRAFGATSPDRDARFRLHHRPANPHAIEAAVPGDISSAAFFLCAARSSPAPRLLLDSLGLNPTRATLLDVLTALGARISVLQSRREKRRAGRRGADLRAGRRPWLTEISGALAAQLIDELPVLAAIAPYTRGGIRIRDAKELRVKESDRIALVAQNLRAMGAESPSSKTASTFPAARRCTAPPSTPAATTASPWPSASPPSAPRARRSSRARNPRPSAFPSSSICWTLSRNVKNQPLSRMKTKFLTQWPSSALVQNEQDGPFESKILCRKQRMPTAGPAAWSAALAACSGRGASSAPCPAAGTRPGTTGAVSRRRSLPRSG